MTVMLAPGWWVAIGALGLVALLCVAVVIAAVVATFKENPIKKSLDVDEKAHEGLFNSHPEEKQDK
jgi:hypothetical protein